MLSNIVLGDKPEEEQVTSTGLMSSLPGVRTPTQTQQQEQEAAPKARDKVKEFILRLSDEAEDTNRLRYSEKDAPEITDVMVDSETLLNRYATPLYVYARNLRDYNPERSTIKVRNRGDHSERFLDQMYELARQSSEEAALARMEMGITESLPRSAPRMGFDVQGLIDAVNRENALRAGTKPLPSIPEVKTEELDDEEVAILSDTDIDTNDADGGAAPSDGKGLMVKPYDELRMREINEPLGEGLVSPDAGILSPRLDGKDGDLAAYVRPFTVTEEELYSFATESFPDNPLAAGALLATIEAESAGGDSMLESGNYTKENALKAAYQGTYKTARKKEVEKIFNNPDLTYTDKDGNIRMTKEGQVKFFNIYYNDKYRGKDYKLGNTKEGDGFRFRGRGPIQLTGKNNYKKYGDMIGVDLVQNPHLVVTDKDVALAVTKAYMKDKGLNNVRSASQLRNIVGHADDEEATKAKARWKRAKEIQKKVTSLAPSTSLRPRSRPNTIMASN